MAENRNTLVDYDLYARGSQVEWYGIRAKNLDYRELVCLIGKLDTQVEVLKELLNGN